MKTGTDSDSFYICYACPAVAECEVPDVSAIRVPALATGQSGLKAPRADAWKINDGIRWWAVNRSGPRLPPQIGL